MEKNNINVTANSLFLFINGRIGDWAAITVYTHSINSPEVMVKAKGNRN